MLLRAAIALVALLIGGEDAFAQASSTWFLAEGVSNAIFDQDILVGNPSATPLTVTVELFPAADALFTGTNPRTFVLPATGRLTVNLKQAFPGLNGAASAQVSAVLQGTSTPADIVVERSLFFPQDRAPLRGRERRQRSAVGGHALDAGRGLRRRIRDVHPVDQSRRGAGDGHRALPARQRDDHHRAGRDSPGRPGDPVADGRRRARHRGLLDRRRGDRSDRRRARDVLRRTAQRARRAWRDRRAEPPGTSPKASPVATRASRSRRSC